jgi:anaerobic magnesium-protoporphyrin IX monomethyl ester cyclase
MNVLLVNPPTGFSYHSLGISRPPLGLAYLASVLRDHHHVKIIDFNVGNKNWSNYPYSEFDIVGISVDTARYLISLRIARRAQDHGAIVVMGGLHVSFLDKDALASGVVDYVVRNEGEYAFLSLVKFLSKEIPLEEVRGVSYLTDGELIRTPDEPFIHDLDSLPFPARELLPLKLYREKTNGRLMTTLITSRGCPFNCDFCSGSQFFGVRWRARSVENIFEEMELLHRKLNYQALQFVDDNFTLNPDRAIKLSEKIIKHGWDLNWGAWSRVDTIVHNPGMVRIMAKAGLKWTFVGFESGSQEVLNGYGKKALVQDALNAMEILRENDVRVTGSFILGGLDETKDMIKETIKFAKWLDPGTAQFTLLTPYPGTKLYEKVKDRLLTKNWGIYTCLHPTIKLDHVSPKELRRFLILAYFSFYGRLGKFLKNMPFFYALLPSALRPLTSKLFVLRGLNSFSRFPLVFSEILCGHIRSKVRFFLGLLSVKLRSIGQQIGILFRKEQRN